MIWITGLSASGKTTTAKIVANKLAKEGFKVIRLDGDELRQAMADIPSMQRFDRESRLTNVKAYLGLAKLLLKQSDYIVFSTISMFKEVYEFNHKSFPNYFEVYLDIPKAVRTGRDFKGIYNDGKTIFQNDVCGEDIRIAYPDKAHLIYKHRDGNKAQDVAAVILDAISDHFDRTEIEISA